MNTPQANPPEANPGDLLLFFRPHRLVDDLIKLMTLSRYYHIGIYAGNGHLWEARPNGVGCNSLEGREGAYVVVPAPGGPEKGAQALAWAATQQGAPLDHRDMLIILLEHLFVRVRLNLVPSGRYSCAEFVATAFYHAGERLFPDRDLNDIEPKDFARFIPPQAPSHYLTDAPPLLPSRSG